MREWKQRLGKHRREQKKQEYQHNSRNELVRKHWQKQVPQSHEKREKNSYPIERPMLSNTCSFLLRIGQMLKKHTDINGRKYFTLLTKPAVRNANVKSQEWIEKHVSEAIPRNIPDRESMNPLLKRVMLILQTDTEVKDMIQGYFFNYIVAVRIESAERTDDDGRDYNVFDDDLTDASRNVSIFHTYIETEVDTTYLNLKEVIQKKHCGKRMLCFA